MSVRALPLARALAGKGYDVTLLLPPWDDRERAGQQWQDAGVRVVNLPLPPGVPLFFHIWLTRTLVARTLALQPDVVHFFKPKAYAGLAHLVLWWLRRLGGVSMRLVLDADDWEQAWNERLPYPAVQKKLFAWQERWGLRHADAVTVASRELENLAAGLRPAQPADIFYVPNGLPAAPPPPSPLTARAVREKWQLEQAPLILLYSRFAEFRLERVVTLVQQVAEQMPPARWLIVGQGLYGEERALAQHLRLAGLQDYVRFAGWPVSDLPAYFAAADVAIYPYDDTLINRTKCSVKLIELLSAGVPVVADAVGQNSEYIEHGASGILVMDQNDAAFSRAVVDLLRAPQQRQRLGQAAAQRMRNYFDWQQLAQVVERAYRR